MLTFTNYKEIVEFIEKNDIGTISFYVIDIEGRLRNVTIPVSYFSEKIILDGIGFDASNFGYAEIEKSDMIFKPDLDFAFLDPINKEEKILYFFCNVFSVDTGESFSQDLRHIITKSLRVLREKGIADEVKLLVELEFNILDEIYSMRNHREISYSVDSSEIANPQDGREMFRIAKNHGYFRSQPTDHTFYLRNEIVKTLEELGLKIKYHHHEVAASQCELEFNFMPIEFAADATVISKNICQRIGRKHEKIISFLPKILPYEAGNGMHFHLYLLKDGKNIFDSDEGLYNLSDTSLSFLSGILSHISSLTAFTNPTTNSYRRLVSGLEAPSKAVFAKGNRSAAIRIPGYVKDPAERRFEFRPADATCNPYLTFAAVLMAGIDGVEKNLDPRKEGFGPLETNLYKLSRKELDKIPSVPESLSEALNNLEKENDYLTYKDVFPIQLIKKWISIKRTDIAEMRKIPHPWEIARYYDL